MTVSELSRKLLFCGYDDITDYLRNSTLNRYLYKQLLVLLPERQISTPIEQVLREIYYQSIRVRFDNKPGIDVSKRYLDEAEQWLGSRDAAILVFEYVWALFNLRNQLSFQEECFIERLRPLLQPYNYQDHLEGILNDLHYREIYVPYEFEPMPCPVNEAPKVYEPDNEGEPLFKRMVDRLFYSYGPYVTWGENVWRELTDNFSHSSIEKYVGVYKDASDQLTLLELIEFACPRKEREKHQDFFYMLKASIQANENAEEKSVFFQIEHEDKNGRHTDRSGFVGKAASEYLDNFARELRNTAEQYKQERDEIRSIYAEQMRNHAKEKARMEAKFQAELEEMRQRLEQSTIASQAPVVEAPLMETAVEDASPKELTLTVSEIVSDVKERFSKQGATELSTMLYRMATKHRYLDESLWVLIESIDTAIEKRDALRQTFNIPSAQQVNINNETVNNSPVEPSDVNHEK